MYDITNRQSFNHVPRWVEELRDRVDGSVMIMLIGNKADLASQREVPTEQAVEFAKDQGLFFSETSALSGDNVETAFLKLIEQIYNVASKKKLDCDDSPPSGKMNGHQAEVALSGSKIDVELGSDLEIRDMKKLSTCSC